MRASIFLALSLAWIGAFVDFPTAFSSPVVQYGAPQSPQWVGTGFCDSIIAPLGPQYNCTEHTVLSNGFLLTLQNIVRNDLNNQINPDGTVSTPGHVLFLHSIFVGGDSWFVATNPTPLALAAKGYSIWIGNERSSKWTFGHQSLNPTQFEFWDWDGDELANYDWPALTSYIYQYTGGRKLHFVGYSQGARVGLGAISYQGNDYFASMTLLAPVIFVAKARAPLLLAVQASNLGGIAYNSRIPSICLSCFGQSFGSLPNATNLKKITIETLTGPNCCIDNDKVFDLYSGSHACTSTKAIAHLTQSMNLENFQAYDFGTPNRNMEVYESYIPPTYLLGNVNPILPILVLYGGNDQFATPADVTFLFTQLPVPPQSRVIPNYGHADFIYSNSLGSDINQEVINFIENFSS